MLRNLSYTHLHPEQKTMKRLLSIALLATISIIASAQSRIVGDFKPVCAQLDTLLRERTEVGHVEPVELKAVMRRGSTLDFYFTQTLGDYPWYKGDPQWFKNTLKSLFPEEYAKNRLGEIYCNRVSLDRFVTPRPGNDGSPSETRNRVKEPSEKRGMVHELGSDRYDKGLSGRHIALWQSHGRYFEQKLDRWEWQRATLFQTVEDMFTQSFVLPYLVPMLENAGAYILMPRERDIQKNEVIVDNDRSWITQGTVEIGTAYRSTGIHSETGTWEDAGKGFADMQRTYSGTENPFSMGSARMTGTISSGSKSGKAETEWRPDIPSRGEYAVYVSYASLPNSSSAACYTVNHLGGTSRFVVNQKIGGGTWIYLGTFEFTEGTEGYVTLSNRTPEGYKHTGGSVVTADAVRFGGGMGNIARKVWTAPDDSVSVVSEASVSGFARSAEGARYWLQWAGADTTIFSQNEGKDDYKDDYMCRGDWVEWITRGSRMNPSANGGLGIPVDLTLGFHSDAGITPNDSIVGTLAIYTSRSDNRQNLPNGESRTTSREFADMVQSQIVNDLQAQYDSLWSRRSIWDRQYRESRTPSSPSMLLELLSHQNFADMKYGLDPSFRFAASRAVYKGMLKYLSNRYGCSYAVQPLPVESMGVTFSEDGRKAVISWVPAEDPLEPTADPSGYILQTRVNDGGFDKGLKIKDVKMNDGRLSTEVLIHPGHIYRFRITAYNEGGKSFPSETVSIGRPAEGELGKTVLVVNNFDRVSAPAYVDTPAYAGFNNRLDSGVPHIRDIAHIGEMYQFNRSLTWIDDENPGHGASDMDKAGEVVAGNTFDYASVHGKAILKAGHSFYSCSNEAFSSDSTFRIGAWTLDLICGKQITTTVGSGMQQKYTVFTPEIQREIRAFTSAGGNILVSGANIGTDIEDSIYPIAVDSVFREKSIKFAREVLGYKWMGNYAGKRGNVKGTAGMFNGTSVSFYNTPNPDCYCVETPDGIVPAGRFGKTVMRYSDTGISAGVSFEGQGYRALSLGFPVETLREEKDIDNIIAITLDFFDR